MMGVGWGDLVGRLKESLRDKLGPHWEVHRVHTLGLALPQVRRSL